MAPRPPLASPGPPTWQKGFPRRQEWHHVLPVFTYVCKEPPGALQSPEGEGTPITLKINLWAPGSGCAHNGKKALMVASPQGTGSWSLA